MRFKKQALLRMTESRTMLATTKGVLTRPVNAARRRALDLIGRLRNRQRGVIGSIDVVSTDVIEGWVKRREDDSPLVVDIFAGPVLVTQGLFADIHRADLQMAGHGTGRHGFSCKAPDSGGEPIEALIEVRLSGTGELLLSCHPPTGTMGAKLASSVPAPMKPQADGINSSSPYKAKIEAVTGSQFRGWAVDRARPGRIFDLQVLVDGVPFVQVRNDGPRTDLQQKGLSQGRGGVNLVLPLGDLESGDHLVSLEMPDGSRIESRVTTVQRPRRRLDGGVPRLRPEDVAVVVPIYNAADDLEVCIDRLARFTPSAIEIVLIDDASPDPVIARLLDRAALRPNTRVLRNAQNLGFTRTVNRGLEETGRKHVVLLNSDARVTPGWIDGMLRAASSRPRVATVTAMSDRAGAFSAPRLGNDNPLPPGVDEITYARAFRRRALAVYPVVPTGNGFCMFVNRACVDEIGGFDAEAFPRGYGEENDFCMRATRAGWANLIDDTTYVFHDRSKSFGETKHVLMEAGRAVIEARYPEYSRAIRVFSTGPDILLARYRAVQARIDCGDRRTGLPAVLFVVSTQTGGTPQTNLDLMRQLQDELDPWLLRCDSQTLTLGRLDRGRIAEIRRHELAESVDPITHRSAEYDAVVADWLDVLDPAIVHIRHLAWHGLSLPELAKARGCKVVTSFHDFYTLCPTVKLLDERQVFCAGRCTATEGDCRPELWPDDSLPPLKHRWVYPWRERFDQVLSVSDAFVTTSDSARKLIAAGLPGVDPDRFHVIPHGRSFAAMEWLAERPEPGEPIRILVPGNIGAPKGRDVIADLLAHDTAGRFEFHILGRLADADAISHPRLIQQGTYHRDEFAARVRAIRPHFGAIFSIWDETYCHTLTELWSVGVPALVFDFPTVAGRVRASGAGWVVPHQDIAALARAINGIAADSAGQDRVAAALADWQGGRGVGRSVQVMAAAYRDLYRQVLGCRGRWPVIAVVAPASPQLDQAEDSTHVRLWERTINHFDRPLNYVRMTAATLLANLREDEVDGVIVQRDAVPRELAGPLLAAMQARGLRHLHELDEDLLAVPADKDPQGSYAAYAPTLSRLLAAAGCVTVSTGPLAARVWDMNRNVEVVPNWLALRLWRGPLPRRERDGTVRALYMGSVTHGEDLALVLPALTDVAARHPDFRLAVIGVQEEPLPRWIERIQIPEAARNYPDFAGWLKAQAGQFDFGLAPLAAQGFNLHKSDLKLLEYGALGLPVLASDLPVYSASGSGMNHVTLVPGDGWRAALGAVIESARRGGADRDRIRRDTLHRFALEPTLPDFDRIVAGLARTGGRG